MKNVITILFLLMFFGSFAAHAANVETHLKEKPAVIHFANSGGIQNWKAESDKVLLIESRKKQWYRAELMGNCYGLRFANAVGFVAEANGSLNKYSSVYIRGARCTFKSFEKVVPLEES